MNVFITGANGYLGGHLVQQLLRKNHVVYGLDSHWRNVCGEGTPEYNLSVAEAIVHLAWYSSAGNAQENLQKQSLEMTSALLDKIDRFSHRVRQFLFASTASVYGDCLDKVFAESDPVTSNCWYTRCKVEAEELIRKRLPQHLILRLGSLMGRGVTRTKTELVVNAFASDAWQKGKIKVWNPDCWRPFIHVADVAEIMVEAIEDSQRWETEKEAKEGWQGTLNVCTNSLTARTIAGLVAAKVSGCTIEETASPNGSRSCRLDRSKLYRWMPEMEYKTIGEVVEEFRGHEPGDSDRNHPERWEMAVEV